MITPATADDEAAVITLWQRCGLTRPWNPPAADFRRALSSEASAVLVGRHDGSIVGSVVVGDDGHRGWVYYLAVDPEHRSAGLGRDLMAAAESWLRNRGCAKLQLMIRADNDQARGFYAALGYAEQPVAVYGRFLD